MQLPKSVRIVVIIQLCFAFMMLAWYVCYPFLGEIYYWRSRLFLVQTVIGDAQLLDYVDDKLSASQKLESNQRLFAELPAYQQDEIIIDLNHYQSMLKRNWKQKAASSLNIFLSRLPPFKEAWLVFAFLVSFLILYRVEGAHLGVWILPIFALCYLIAARGYPSGTPPDAKLFPTEEQLPVNGDFSKAWEDYLSNQWGGEFYFNAARLKELRSHSGYSDAYQFKQREPLFLLLLYFAWNLFFAYICYKKCEMSRCKNPLKIVFGQR